MKKSTKYKKNMGAATIAMATAMAIAIPQVAFATQQQIDQITKPINNLYDLLLALVIAIGSIVTLWGVFELGMSFWHQDPTGKIQAIPKIAGGAVMLLAGIVVAIVKS
jgi:hypothetical protein